MLDPLYPVAAAAAGLLRSRTTAKMRRAARRTSATLGVATMEKNQIALMTLVILCAIPQIAPMVLALPRSDLKSSQELFVQLPEGR